MSVAAVAAAVADESGPMAGMDTHSHRLVIAARDGQATASRSARSLGLGAHVPPVALHG